jgi:anti-anti-sigma factor
MTAPPHGPEGIGVVCNLDSAAAVSRGEHVSLFFEDGQEQRQLLAFSMLTGLERGEKVLYFADITPAAAIPGWLRHAGVDPEPYLRRGQLTVTSAAEAFLRLGNFDSERALRRLQTENQAAQRAGHTGLRVATEMSWALRGTPGCADLPEFERRVNEVVAAGPPRGIVAICQYDLRRFQPGQVDGLHGMHGLSVRGPTMPAPPALRIKPLEDAPGLKLGGEIDLTNFHEFAAALTDAVSPGQDLYLDMADLRFVEVAAIRMLVRVANRFRDGRRLVVWDPPPMFNRVLRASGCDLPGALSLTERNTSREQSA